MTFIKRLSPEYLSININIRYKYYDILIQFRRPVFYGAGETQYVKYGGKTWQENALRFHGSDPVNIIQMLHELLYDFLNEYLAVNQT